ncbi:hypothetical protein Murru_0443 [Allomuricauda ruestringensis DSM 13258]|uniref:Uncharacterized protein n=1 Tax=Allomuricauda ruestringensis (strain DSM 13258 / CIP 107369 / LMG 19739 / B1) TaxID=886377 RepID=G2PRP8_ALLRU|nr:hypothetical protein Murru_0443 [Allomuricauda ruestringensis DSM 13258]
MKLNKNWHIANKMPKNPTIYERIEWHLEHQKNCECRDIPEKLKLEINKRGLQTKSKP